MKFKTLPVLFLVCAVILTACGVTATSVPSTQPVTVEDEASFIAALQASNATTEIADPIIQDFFSPEGSIIKVNGADVQVFEYENSQAMESEASMVAPDGGSIGTSMVTWMDAPHFYKVGRIIVLYVGSDPAILGLLEKVIGPQFAGQ